MNVIVDMNPENKLFHSVRCLNALVLPEERKGIVTKHEALEMGFCACPDCHSLTGAYDIHVGELYYLEEKEGVEIRYLDNKDTLFIRTDVGFWKIFAYQDTGDFALFHRNCYDKDATFLRLTYGNFHRQHDAKQTDSLMKLIYYVINHDKAKKIIAEDYRKLPQRTRRERKYYRIARNRNRKQQIYRVDALFRQIEEGTDLKLASIC